MQSVQPLTGTICLCCCLQGDKYSVWKLSDLTSVTNVVTLFLFGEAHKEHWKVSLGDVVAVLNPSVKAEPKTVCVRMYVCTYCTYTVRRYCVVCMLN